ncbi:unnamed protein product, partial [Scytosiphon promiscuus]
TQHERVCRVRVDNAQLPCATMPPSVGRTSSSRTVGTKVAESSRSGRKKDRVKREAVALLVQELCTGPAADATTVIRTALERGYRSEFQVALKEFEAKKSSEISRVCHRHYSEFIDSVEDLMKMKTDMVGLKDQVVDLDSRVQATGGSALSTAKELLQQRHATRNVEAASQVIRQCDGVVNMVMDAFVHIHEERYYSALNTVDQINQRLDAMDSVKFASQLRRWMPSLTEMINKATKEEMSQWLVDIREVSYKMGSAAMRRYTKIQGASTESGAGLEGDGGGTRSQAMMTHSVRFLLRLGDLLGCGLTLNDDELSECVPELLRGRAEDKEQEEKALDRLSDHLHPVHRALHIFARLGMLDDFKAWYLECRRPMAEMRSMITRDIDKLDTDAFLTYLPTLANGIGGFFIVEQTLLQQVDHREGLLTLSQLEESWMQSQLSLSGLIQQHMTRLSRPGHFLQVKETVLALVSIMHDLKMDTHVLMNLVRALKDPFRKLVLVEFEIEIRRIVEGETYQPLDVQTIEEFETLISPMGLDKADRAPQEVPEGGDPSRFMDVIDDSFYFGVEEDEEDANGPESFPVTYPFSATVPEIGLALLKMSALVVTFLSHLDVPNASAVVFKSLQKGTLVVQTLMLDQLRDAETDMHILKASQISVNSAYLAQLPIFLASALGDVLVGMQFADFAWKGKGAKADGSGKEWLSASGKALEDISDRSRDLIFELVRSKADDLLAGMEFVNMEPTSMRRQPHPYADDLINYLRVTFMNLATLPASIREAVHFTCMTHVCNAILEHITGPNVRTVNVLGVHNVSLDIAALTDFADESGISTLRECFSKLLQLVDIVLTNNIDIASDPARMTLAYPRLDVRHLASLLAKYRDLSLAAKIRNTVGDEVPQIDPNRVTAIVKRLKQQG